MKPALSSLHQLHHSPKSLLMYMQGKRKRVSSTLTFHFLSSYSDLFFTLFTWHLLLSGFFCSNFSGIHTALSYYSHLQLSSAQEQQCTTSALIPLHSFLPATAVKNVCPHLGDGKDISSYFPASWLLFLNSVLLHLTQHNLVKAKALMDRAWTPSPPFFSTIVSFWAPTLV